jgi:hypothetical protein
MPFRHCYHRSTHGAFLAAVGLNSIAAAQFTNTPAQIPATGSQTENVDFADVDHDGDFDAILADGGDTSQDQNRIYINLGGMQVGPIGFFQDQTAVRFPVQNTDGRDIEFADIDQDGDFDIYTANTAELLNQGNHWWVDTSGSGNYTDQTATRWVNLGGAGSSIPPAAVLAGNTFIDWSCDCDFGDMDNDGDLDLFHSSYGGAFGGQVPTRLFLNSGSGVFSEFNPSAPFQLTSTNIANGNPGIWCQGVQTANTTNTTGTNCDIASSTLDIDTLDADGDFDLDLLHGARQEAPRYFKNLLAENASLAWRDVTGSALPAGYWSGGDNYEQEQGDMDNDGDSDLYGLNWPGLSDAVFNNASTAGTITYGSMQTLASSGNDDSEGDFLDYDDDGDLDLVIAAFFSTNRLYRNNYAGGSPGAFSYTYVNPSGLTNARSLDSDVADIDNDGDYDIMTAEDANQNEKLYKNTLNAGDSHAPRIARVESVADQDGCLPDFPVRAHVYDSGNYYTTWYNDTRLRITVNGAQLPEISARSSMGQVFRAIMPGNLLGSVSYWFESTDEHSNTGTSTVKTFQAGGAGSSSYGTLYGSNSYGSWGPPGIYCLSQPQVGSCLYLDAEFIPPGTATSIYLSKTKLYFDAGAGKLYNLDTLPGALLASWIQTASSNGSVTVSYAVPAALANTKIYAQVITEDAVRGNMFASSHGLEIVVP